MVMRNIKLQPIRYKPFLRRRWIRPTGNCKPARIDLLLLVLFPPVADFPRPDILQDFLLVLSSEFIQIVSVYITKYMNSPRFRLQRQNCKFFTTPLSRNSQKRLKHKENQTKYRKMTRKPRSHVRILIYRTWAILKQSRAHVL